MSEALKEKWNTSHAGIPKDKDVSNYALEVEEKFPRNSYIVDIGGGTGADALYFAQKGHRVLIVDISDYALSVAKEKADKSGLQIETRQVSLGEEPLPLEDASLDIVYSRLSLHYFDAETTAFILRDIYRVMKNGATAYLTIKSPEDIKEMEFLTQTATQLEPGVFNDNGDIKSRFTIEQVRRTLEEAGITNAVAHSYKEDLSGRKDKVKSGNKVLILTEVIFTKS